MTISHWQRNHSFTTADLTCDVLILGGGFAGLSTAFWLVEMRSDLKIVVLERDFCGSGASGRNAGFLTKGSAFFYHSLIQKWGATKALEIFNFADTSLKLMQQNLFSTSPELKVQNAISFTLMRKPSDQMMEEMKPFPFTWKSSEKLPASLGHSFSGAWETDAEFKINPMELIKILKAKLESKKVRIIESSTAFEATSTGVRTDLNFIKSPITVMALNGYTGEFDSAYKELIAPKRAQMLAVDLDAPLELPNLYYDPAERVYFRQVQNNSLVIGGKRLMDEKNEEGVFDKINPLIQHELEKYLSETLKLKFKVTERWSGIMGFTQSELPFVKKAKDKGESYILGGFSGHGMGLGFHAAKEMAELVLTKKTESFFSKISL